MIALDQVGKRSLVEGEPGAWALRDVTFRIATPRVVAVMGGGWEDRALLLQLVSGQERPTSGSVAVDGRVAHPLKYIAQLQPFLTGRQNARFIARVVDGDGSLDQRLAAIAECSQLGDKFLEPVKGYTHQMRAKLSFALSVCLRFDAYVCDSARLAGGLGFGSEEAAGRWIDETAAGAMLLISVQKPSQAEFVLSRSQSAIVMGQGSAVWYEDVADAPRPTGRRPRRAVEQDDSDTMEDIESDDEL